MSIGVKCTQKVYMYINIVYVGVQCTQKVYMYRNIVSVVVPCTQKVYMYRNIVFVIGFCTFHVHFHSVCYMFLYKPLVQNFYNRHYGNVRLISAIVKTDVRRMVLGSCD